MAKMAYECKGCGSSSAVLKHIQKNTKRIPCIKCNNARSHMFVFCCDLRHTICLMCFSGYCQMRMNNEQFRMFDVGYSVSCPVPDCADSPVRDPHHFFLVNRKFYEMFQYTAAQHYQPEGSIFCTCYTEIDFSTTVADTSMSRNDEQGGVWWIWRSKANRKPSAKDKSSQMRRKVTCPNTECGKSYCTKCKSLWHGDSNCVEKTEPSKDDVFEIYEPYEKAARWPQQP